MMKNFSVIALVLAISALSFAQAPAPKQEPSKATTTATATPEKTAEPCKGLEGTKLQECLAAEAKATGTTTQPTANPQKPAQQN